MALNLPENSDVIKSRIKTDIQVRLPLSNPFLKGSWLRAFAEGLAERMYDFYYAITQSIEEIFPDTTSENLDRWGSFYNLSRLAATRSSGIINLQGSSDGTLVPVGHKITDNLGNVYSIITGGSVDEKTIAPTAGITHSSGDATYLGDQSHYLNSGDEITISGAATPGYNGTFAVTPINATDFTFQVDQSIPTSTAPAGTITQSTLTRVDTTATFVATASHNLNSNDIITISGASDALYNGSAVITVTASDTFTYTLSASAAASATGASVVLNGGEFTVISGFVEVQSDESGSNKNLDPFALTTLQTPISGVDDACGVDENALIGGSDIETTDAFRDRILDVIRHPVAHFNVSDISRVAKTVSLVTRVFVKEATPAEGQVTIYPMVDNETNPIPGAATTTAVKNALLAIKPANTSDADVIVTAPTSVTTDFDFSSLNPSTSTMKSSIEENLKQFFATKVEVGTTVTEDAYRSAIFSTIDTTTGSAIVSFGLNSPTGDLTPTSSQIRTLGSFTYP